MSSFGSRLKLPFPKKQKLAVGLDIGSHAIKMCEISDTGKGYQLLSLGSAMLPNGAVEDGVLQDPAAVGKVIKNLIANLKIKEKKVAISISGYSVIVKKINLAKMNDKDMEVHINSEAEQYIPFDIDDVYLDFQSLDTDTQNEDRTDVMLVAAKRDVVDGFLEMLSAAGLTAVVVDVDVFALENAFEANCGLDENVMLVDIGATKMNINIISHGISILARDAILGSRQLTEQIQHELDIPFNDAEALKRGMSPAGDNQQVLEDIFVKTCREWLNEIKRAMDFYYSNNSEEAIDKLILSGGGARVAGLDRFLYQETNIPVEIFNPFLKVGRGGKIDEEYTNYIAPEMAIAMGLAIRPASF